MVWVVPLSESKLTPDPRFLTSSKYLHLELDRKASPCEPKLLNPYLYLKYLLHENMTTAIFGWNQLSPLSIGFSPLNLNQKNTCP